MGKTTSAFIVIVGKPNAGKSSILNKIIGQKVAIVSNKPQTTRTKISGILTQGEMQLVFIDTPGLLKPKNLLGQKMVKAVHDGMDDVDCCLLVVEANDKISPAEEELIAKFKKRNLHAVLAINKIDLLENKQDLFPIIQKYSALYDFDAIVPTDALAGDGIENLLEEFKKHAKESVHYFDTDSFTDQPERVLCAEMIREKLLRNLDKEIPHGIAVDIERFRERDNQDILDIDAAIYCEKASHKGIIIGKGGNMLKKIGQSARGDLERFFEIKVNLKLWVKVKENWRSQNSVLTGLGLD